MPAITHLRLRVDQLTHRVEHVHDADERRRLSLECSELERAIGARVGELEQESADLAAAHRQLRRLIAHL